MKQTDGNSRVTGGERVVSKAGARIHPSRGKAMVQDLFSAVRPEVWVLGTLGSQRGHGLHWQVCLAQGAATAEAQARPGHRRCGLTTCNRDPRRMDTHGPDYNAVIS